MKWLLIAAGIACVGVVVIAALAVVRHEPEVSVVTVVAKDQSRIPVPSVAPHAPCRPGSCLEADESSLQSWLRNPEAKAR